MNSNASSNRPTNEKPVILIVEDNNMYRSVMAAALGQYIAGSEIIEATNVKEALAALIDRQVNVVVADMTLPDGSALSFVDAAQAYIQSGMRVFITSNLSAEDMQPLVGRKDVAGYVEKTKGLVHLAAAITRE